MTLLCSDKIKLWHVIHLNPARFDLLCFLFCRLSTFYSEVDFPLEFLLKIKEIQFLVCQAQRLSLMDHLPAEPGSECTDPVSNLRFRLPNGDTVARRFLASNPLQVWFISDNFHSRIIIGRIYITLLWWYVRNTENLWMQSTNTT